MQTHSLYLSQKSLRIKIHDSRYSNNEDYHGGVSVTVPFNWELEPGTPKVKSSEIPSLPPLTPPPSYFYSATPKRSVKNQYHSTPAKLLDTIVPKRYRRRTGVQLCPSSSSSSSGSSSGSSSPWPRSYSVPSSPIRELNSDEQAKLSRGRLFSDSRADEVDLRECKSYTVSTPCFGRSGAGTRSGGFCSTLLKVLRRHE